tara:strand:+ start:13544 stop:13843 length:300 start_codon:yes stop_codon:yes gene_type:complete
MFCLDKINTMNRFYLRSLSAVFFVIAFIFSFETLASEVSVKKQSDAKRVFAKASKTKSSSSWHFLNLYDDSLNSFLSLTICGRALNGMAKNLSRAVCMK